MLRGSTLQSTPCHSLHSAYKRLPKCQPCKIALESHLSKRTRSSQGHTRRASRDEQRDENDPCRFMGIRYITPKSSVVDFTFPSRSDPIPRTVFNRFPNEDDIKLLLYTASKSLLPKLERERAHASKPGVISRGREAHYRSTCDICNTALFSEEWFCTDCGFELCMTCVEEADVEVGEGRYNCASSSKVHVEDNLAPVTRFDPAELADALEKMQKIVSSEPPDTYPTAAAQAPSPEVHEVPRIPLKQLTPSTYDQYCGRGIPLVVTGIAFQGRWAPLDIVQRYGDHVVRIEDCESGEVTQSTAGEFFRNFGKISETTQGASACKVKDWPPSEDFASKFPELQQAFMTALPFPDVQRCDGVLNLAAHFPTNMCPPDLGPKAYNGQATIINEHSHGSTRLHMDFSSAINIKFFSSDPQRPAKWELFRPEEAGIVSQFVKERCGHDGPGHPIHSQQVYLNPPLLDLLYEEHGIRPYTVFQYPFDAVANLSCSIKIAADFVSISCIPRVQALEDGQRQHRLHTEGSEDLLQLYHMLWYAFVSLSNPSFLVLPSPPSAPSSSLLSHTLPRPPGTGVHKERNRLKRDNRPYIRNTKDSGVRCPVEKCSSVKRFKGRGMEDHARDAHGLATQELNAMLATLG